MDNAVADSPSMRLNSTGVAEGFPCNAHDRKVTRSSRNREVFFQLLEYWSRPWIKWQGTALSLVWFRKTGELKVDILYVHVN